MPLLRFLLGRPLSNREESTERVGVWKGVSVYGLDALGSAAYGPEAALTMLIPAGLLGLRYVLPLAVIIVALLLTVYVSYLQTIGAYPGGGGAYTVAGQNLGLRVGMFAGAALMLDYLLNVSVGISTGIGALVSAVPRLQTATLPLCLGVLGVLILTNLRGMREAGALWMLPTYVFVLCLLSVVAVGCWKTLRSGGHPHPVASFPPPVISRAAGMVAPWLLVRSFAAGCTALTGVEAVSNGVRNFADPKERRARATLSLLVGILAVLLLGISYLVHSYGITATRPAEPGYQSVLSMLTGAVLGRGTFYYITIASILSVLSLSANTSFADFPLLCRVMADDGYLPRTFTARGRRLAYTTGILVLGFLSAAVLMLFGGVTDRLIPLFAIGAFTAFTLSQAGMVGHWLRSDDPHARVYVAINATGAVATGVTTLIVFVAKFKEGAWLTAVLLAFTVLLLGAMRRHNERVERMVQVQGLSLQPLAELPTMLVPVSRWNRASEAALQFACSLSDDVRVLHIAESQEEAEKTRQQWQDELDKAAQQSGMKAPRVVALASLDRSITRPLMRYVTAAERESPGRKIGVVIAEVVASHWYHHVMHNYKAMLLKLQLFLKGNRRVVIVDMPWQLPPT